MRRSLVYLVIWVVVMTVGVCAFTRRPTQVSAPAIQPSRFYGPILSDSNDVIVRPLIMIDDGRVYMGLDIQF